MNSTVRDESPAVPANRQHPAPTAPVLKGVPGGRFNYLGHLQRLYATRLGPWTRAAHFVLVGSTGLVIDLLVFSLLLAWAASAPHPSRTLILLCVMAIGIGNALNAPAFSAIRI